MARAPSTRQFLPFLLNLLLDNMPQCFGQLSYIRNRPFGLPGTVGNLMSHIADFVHGFGYLLTG